MLLQLQEQFAVHDVENNGKQLGVKSKDLEYAIGVNPINVVLKVIPVVDLPHAIPLIVAFGLALIHNIDTVVYVCDHAELHVQHAQLVDEDLTCFNEL